MRFDGKHLSLNLKTAVGDKKDVQDSDVQREFEKRVVTLLVMSAFSDFLGASRACAFFRDPAAVFRLKGEALGRGRQRLRSIDVPHLLSPSVYPRGKKANRNLCWN